MCTVHLNFNFQSRVKNKEGHFLVLSPGEYRPCGDHHIHYDSNTATFKKCENITTEPLWLDLSGCPIKLYSTLVFPQESSQGSLFYRRLSHRRLGYNELSYRRLGSEHCPGGP